MEKWQIFVDAVLISWSTVSFSRNTDFKIVLCCVIYVSVCWIRPYGILFKYCFSITVKEMAWHLDSSLREFYTELSGRYTVSDVWMDLGAPAVKTKCSKSWDCLVLKTFRVVLACLTMKVNALPSLETRVKIYQ